MLLADTWEWDGTTWTDRTPATSPPARAEGGMIYDRYRKRIVLFGGAPSGAFLADTWEYDGTTWTEVTPAASPSGRARFAVGYDSRARAMLIFGGYSGSTLDETWAFDGTTWTQLQIPVSPPVRDAAGGTYDDRHGRFVIMGGELEASFYSDTWTYGFESAVDPPETCDLDIDSDGDGLVGCADPDCWARCDPQCAPGETGCDPARPRCGDGACSATEDFAICPADCPAP